MEYRNVEQYGVKVSACGDVILLKSGKRKNPTSCRGGYIRVTVGSRETRKSTSVHRLVAIAFLPNPDNKPCVNHLDGNKTNNHVSNLEWCTYSENQLHAHSNRLYTRVGRHEKTDRNEMIRALKATKKWSSAQLADVFEISIPNIGRICAGRTNTKPRLTAKN